MLAVLTVARPEPAARFAAEDGPIEWLQALLFLAAGGVGHWQATAAGRDEDASSLPGSQGLSGLDVQRRLADAGLGVPIIIITAHDRAETGAKCLAAGAVAYLHKPLEDETLLGASARAIDAGRVPRT
jgi:DNA-binding LytR/AlgR family response regulator